MGGPVSPPGKVVQLFVICRSRYRCEAEAVFIAKPKPYLWRSRSRCHHLGPTLALAHTSQNTPSSSAKQRNAALLPYLHLLGRSRPPRSLLRVKQYLRGRTKIRFHAPHHTFFGPTPPHLGLGNLTGPGPGVRSGPGAWGPGPRAHGPGLGDPGARASDGQRPGPVALLRMLHGKRKASLGKSRQEDEPVPSTAARTHTNTCCVAL